MHIKSSTNPFNKLQEELQEFGVSCRISLEHKYFSTSADPRCSVHLDMEMNMDTSMELLEFLEQYNANKPPTELAIASGITIKAGDILVDTGGSSIHGCSVTEVVSIESETEFTCIRFMLATGRELNGVKKVHYNSPLANRLQHATGAERSMYQLLKEKEDEV